MRSNIYDLRQNFDLRYGSAEIGWSPLRRKKHGYHWPSEHYEVLVRNLSFQAMNWLDVGGGKTPFPENPKLAHILATECERFVVVEPSDNINQNEFAHERINCLLEDFHSDAKFDLITLRMVAEHVENPDRFCAKLWELLSNNGKVVILTVDKWSPVSLIASIVPNRLHYSIKRLFWTGSQEDTFPTKYKMNTRRDLIALARRNKLEPIRIQFIDDLSVFGRFRTLGGLELRLWKTLNSLGVPYPERCILAVFQKASLPAQVSRSV